MCICTASHWGCGVIVATSVAQIHTRVVTPGRLPVWEGALFIPILYQANLWAVFCVTPVLHAVCGVLVECLMCSHGLVPSGCCAVVVTSPLPATSAGCLWVTAVVRCVLRVRVEGGPVGMCFVSWWGRCVGLGVVYGLLGGSSPWLVGCCFCVADVLGRPWRFRASLAFSAQRLSG